MLSDGRRLVLTDTGLRGVLGTATVPAESGRLLDLTFAGPGRLLGSGRQGGLTLWELDGAEPRPTVRRDTPRLRNLFAVPAWQVVGGLAPSEGRVHFYDRRSLAPVPVPPHLADTVEWPRVLRCSPDGRFVAYAGRPVADPGTAPPCCTTCTTRARCCTGRRVHCPGPSRRCSPPASPATATYANCCSWHTT
ncbi:hypothetical protein ACFQ0T_03480 [Kitasatospora gansuensis]